MTSYSRHSNGVLASTLWNYCRDWDARIIDAHRAVAAMQSAHQPSHSAMAFWLREVPYIGTGKRPLSQSHSITKQWERHMRQVGVPTLQHRDSSFGHSQA